MTPEAELCEDEARKIKDAILIRISDLIADFFSFLIVVIVFLKIYYDRKEDEELPRGAIEDAVEHELITAPAEDARVSGVDAGSSPAALILLYALFV